MTVFDEIYAGYGLPHLWSTLGQLVTYVSADGAETETAAIVGPVRDQEEEDYGGRKLRRRRSVTLPAVLGATTKGEMRLDGETWAIESIEAADDSTTRVSCVRVLRSEADRRGLRRL